MLIVMLATTMAIAMLIATIVKFYEEAQLDDRHAYIRVRRYRSGSSSFPSEHELPRLMH